MPTYSYRCDSCEHAFEIVQRFADEPLTECPECGARIRRVIQPVGVVFKGSGWYITDSRPKSGSEGGDGAAKAATATDKASKSDKSESGTKSDSSTKSDGKSDSKSEKTPAKVAD